MAISVACDDTHPEGCRGFFGIAQELSRDPATQMARHLSRPIKLSHVTLVYTVTASWFMDHPPSG